jgi:hypothetical protein
VSCRGEGLFQKHLAGPVDAIYRAYSAAVSQKNDTLFRDLGSYPLPEPADADLLVGAAVLAAMRRHGVTADHLAGEKTPENIFLFPRL